MRDREKQRDGQREADRVRGQQAERQIELQKERGEHDKVIVKKIYIYYNQILVGTLKMATSVGNQVLFVLCD